MDTYRFTVGDFECVSLCDGAMMPGIKMLFANAEPEALASALRDYTVRDERTPTSMNCLLVARIGWTMLIDTGIGKGRIADGGRLVEALNTAGYSADQISVVLISHAHPDHIGGASDAASNLTFPNARHVLTSAEWEYWHSPAAAERNAEERLQFIRSNLRAIQPALKLIPMDAEVFPGISVIPAPGHSPGQVVIKIESQGQRLYFTADTITHPVHLARPDWHTAMDSDPREAVQTRLALLRTFSRSPGQYFGYHFPFPGLYDIPGNAQG